MQNLKASDLKVLYYPHLYLRVEFVSEFINTQLYGFHSEVLFSGVFFTCMCIGGIDDVSGNVEKFGRGVNL